MLPSTTQGACATQPLKRFELSPSDGCGVPLARAQHAGSFCILQGTGFLPKDLVRAEQRVQNRDFFFAVPLRFEFG